MNERLDHVRRRVARSLDDDVAKDLKDKKFILLKGEESLDANGQEDLARIKAISSDLTDAYILKERLRTNALMEGFNGKVRWLIKQAFGFRDFNYFRLKIFDLPLTDTRKRL